MRVARYDMADPKFPVSLVEVDDPLLPGPGWARVHVALGGICGSDVHVVYPDGSGSRIFGPFAAGPSEMGHEICGSITEAGPECPWPVGTTVAVDPTITCAARGLEPCARCATGAYSVCARRSSRVVSPGFALGGTVGLGGGWGDAVLAHASQLHPLPDGVDERGGVLTEPLSIAVHAVLRRPPVDGAPVLVVGAGMIGLTAVAALRHLVPSSEVTVLAKHPHQARAARSLGAHHVVVPDAGNGYTGELAHRAGATVVGRKDGAMLVGGYPTVVEAVGSGGSISQSLRFVAERGTVHLVGCAGITTLDLGPAWFREVEVVGTMMHAVDDHDGERVHSFDRALAMLAAGALPPEIVLTHELPLAELRRGCEVAHDRASGAIKVVLRP